MSHKKDNEVLEQRRKAREDYIHLKMMQQGKEQAPPKPSEVAIVPKTFKDKIKNIWFHDKLYIIAALFLSAIVAVCVVQCSRKIDYDLKIVVFANEMLGSDALEPMGDYFEQYCEDINGDGEVNIQILNCTFNKSQRDVQFQNANYQKLTSIIAAEPSALLYITDAEAYQYLTQLAEGIEFFEGEPVTLGSEFYEKSMENNNLLSYVPQNLAISCRKLDESVLISSDKNIDKYYEQSQKILAAVKN